MQEKLPKNLKLIYSSDVIDIVQFGSSVLFGSKPNDIDIAVIFNKIPLKNQLDESQKIKNQLKIYFDIPVHIKSYDLYSFFDKGNFAKESIIFSGKSLITNQYFSKIFGLVPKIQISYSLSKLKKKDKVRFNYMLNGKKGSYGLLRKYSGVLVKPGLIEVDPEYENLFVNSIKEITPVYDLKKIFVA